MIIVCCFNVFSLITTHNQLSLNNVVNHESTIYHPLTRAQFWFSKITQKKSFTHYHSIQIYHIFHPIFPFLSLRHSPHPPKAHIIHPTSHFSTRQQHSHRVHSYHAFCIASDSIVNHIYIVINPLYIIFTKG